jgi:hypothetical protein
MIVLETSIVHSGEKSVHIIDPTAGGGDRVITMPNYTNGNYIPAKLSSEYTFIAWVYVKNENGGFASDTKFVVDVTYSDGNDETTTGSSQLTIDNFDTWTKIEYSYSIVSQADRQYVSLKILEDEGVGKDKNNDVYVDDFRVIEK